MKILKALTILSAILVNTVSASQEFCNGQASHDTWGSYYPNGQKTFDTWGTYYPNGQKTQDTWGSYYPNGRKTFDTWGIYYPNGQKIIDTWGCYSENGDKHDCSGGYFYTRAFLNDRNIEVRILVNIETKEIVRLSFEEQIGDVFTLYDVVNGNPSVMAGFCDES